MKDGFQQYKPSQNKRKYPHAAKNSKQALATICKSGALRINAAAAKMYEISEGSHAILFYHQSKKIIGLKLLPGPDPDALKFSNGKDGSLQMSARRFVSDCGIAKTITQTCRRMSRDQQTGMILIHDVMNQETAEFEAAVNRSEEEA